MQHESLLVDHWTDSLEDTEMVVSVNHPNSLMKKPVTGMGEYSSPDPPFETTYKNLFNNLSSSSTTEPDSNLPDLTVVEELIELPLIDLSKLNRGISDQAYCKKQIARASREWGFFQVINHGVSRQVLDEMRAEQIKLLHKPFLEKKTYKDLNFSAGCYRCGAPTATSLKQISWSECFHVSLSDVIGSTAVNSTLSSTMEQFATVVSELAQVLAVILAEEIGQESGFFRETCVPASCYLRLNRYPRCPLYPQMYGIIPHTDSDFLTVLHQDDIGGLQIVKDGMWLAVKPNPQALIINIGDLFQAYSNNVYRSVEHRVVTNAQAERFSTAYFFCPSDDTLIKSGAEPGAYRGFSFGEFRKQVAEDVRFFGHKIGLARFLAAAPAQDDQFLHTQNIKI